MKYIEREYYRGRWYFGNQSSATIKNWFKVKDTAFRGIKHVTKRHRRSIAKRDLHRFFPRYVLKSYIDDLCKPAVKINMVFVRIRIKDDGLLGLDLVDFPRYKGRFMKEGCRLVWY